MAGRGGCLSLVSFVPLVLDCCWAGAAEPISTSESAAARRRHRGIVDEGQPGDGRNPPFPLTVLSSSEDGGSSGTQSLQPRRGAPRRRTIRGDRAADSSGPPARRVADLISMPHHVVLDVGARRGWGPVCDVGSGDHQSSARPTRRPWSLSG